MAIDISKFDASDKTRLDLLNKITELEQTNESLRNMIKAYKELEELHCSSRERLEAELNFERHLNSSLLDQLNEVESITREMLHIIEEQEGRIGTPLIGPAATLEPFVEKLIEAIK